MKLVYQREEEVPADGTGDFRVLHLHDGRKVIVTGMTAAANRCSSREDFMRVAREIAHAADFPVR